MGKGFSEPLFSYIIVVTIKNRGVCVILTKVAAVSGYKAYELGIFKKSDQKVDFIKTAIKKNLLSLIDDGLEWVLISGGLGSELWTAEVVFSLQEEGYELKLAVITPFLNQEQNWSDVNKEWYESILLQADYVNSVSKKPYEKPWQLRIKNQFFIEKSDLLLLFYDLEKEGSPKYMYEVAKDFQQHHNYKILLIDFYQLQEIYEEEQMKRQGF